jgi:lactate dehydrogenase-like 2-hydroxyacid dehydrogenase
VSVIETVLATEPEFAKGGEVFAGASGLRILPAPQHEAELAARVRAHRVRAVILGAGRYVGPLYAALGESAEGRGAVIARFGVGHDGVDKGQARRHGIIVCNTPGALDISVAEHAIWLMGALARHVCRLAAQLRGGQFAGETGSELHGKRLGILGFGRIGSRVAAMAHAGLGMRVLAAGALTVAELERREGRALADLQAAYGLERYTTHPEEVLAACDVLSIHLPALPATRRFVDADRLAVMSPAALLVNTARGSVLDEEALYDALASGRLAGAALDVFEHEPYRPVTTGKDLRVLPTTLLTPHVGSDTREANRRMAESCLANIARFLSGKQDRLDRVDTA